MDDRITRGLNSVIFNDVAMLKVSSFGQRNVDVSILSPEGKTRDLTVKLEDFLGAWKDTSLRHFVLVENELIDNSSGVERKKRIKWLFNPKHTKEFTYSDVGTMKASFFKNDLTVDMKRTLSAYPEALKEELQYKLTRY